MRSTERVDQNFFEPLEPRLLLSTTVFSEGFEGLFPGPWTTNLSQGRRWGESIYMSYDGWNSAHCGVTQYGTETNNYVNNMQTQLSRTVDLSGYDEATLSFWYWMNAEYGYDGILVKANGDTIGSDNQGPTGDWFRVELSLDDYCGQGSVQITFEFYSDYSTVPMGVSGVWLDNIVLTATEAAPPEDPDDALSEAPLVQTVPFFASDAIQPDTDVDMYEFVAIAGKNIEFEVGPGWFVDLDSYLRLFDASGNELAANDDRPLSGGTDAYLQYTFAQTGMYYIGVSASGNTAYDPITGAGDVPGGTTGDYYLNIRYVNDADVVLYNCQVTPTALQTGTQDLALTYQVGNSGPRILTDDPYVIDLYLSADDTITVDDTRIGEYPLSLSLGARGCVLSTVGMQVTVPAGLTSGMYHLGGHVRSTGGIADGDADNNWFDAGLVSVTAAPKPGDADGNGSVDLLDFVLLKQNFGVTTGATWDMGDFNRDGAVNLNDFVILKQNFGRAATATPVVVEHAAVVEQAAEVAAPAPVEVWRRRVLARRLRRRVRRVSHPGKTLFDALAAARVMEPVT